MADILKFPGAAGGFVVIATASGMVSVRLFQADHLAHLDRDFTDENSALLYALPIASNNRLGVVFWPRPIDAP